MGGPRLAPELGHVVAAAHEVARRRGHERVGGDHLLLALATAPIAGLGPLSLRRISTARLAVAIGGRLDKSHASAGYRDIVMADDERGALFERARRDRRLWRIFHPLSIADVLVAMETFDNTRAVLDMARFDVTVVREFAARAERAAKKRGHANVLAEHALLTVCDDPSFRGPLEAPGIDVDALRTAWDKMLTRRFVSAKLASPDALIASACVWAHSQHRDTLSILTLIVSLLRNKDVAEALDSAELSVTTVLQALLHGLAAGQDGDDEGEGPAQVLFYDDAYTTMELVVKVLTKVFDLSTTDATAAMIAVHTNGVRAIGTFERDEARARRTGARDGPRRRHAATHRPPPQVDGVTSRSRRRENCAFASASERLRQLAEMDVAREPAAPQPPALE